MIGRRSGRRQMPGWRSCRTMVAGPRPPGLVSPHLLPSKLLMLNMGLGCLDKVHHKTWLRTPYSKELNNNTLPESIPVQLHCHRHDRDALSLGARRCSSPTGICGQGPRHSEARIGGNSWNIKDLYTPPPSPPGTIPFFLFHHPSIPHYSTVECTSSLRRSSLNNPTITAMIISLSSLTHSPTTTTTTGNSYSYSNFCIIHVVLYTHYMKFTTAACARVN